MTWRAEAACAGMGPAIFYPTSNSAEAAAPARAVCDRCPVRDACLDDALAINVYADFGIRAGTTDTQRRSIRRKRGTNRTRKAAA